MDRQQIKHIIEAAIFSAGDPISIDQLKKLFDETDMPTTDVVRNIIQELKAQYETTALILHEVASGYRFQTKPTVAPWIHKIWEEKPARYSRSLLETLAIIAYRQPITRPEIEAIRGVAVNTSIVKTLTEREWIRVVGYRDVPGKPALYATTKSFLDHFNLKSLEELPSLIALRQMDEVEVVLPVQLEIPLEEAMVSMPADLEIEIV